MVPNVQRQMYFLHIQDESILMMNVDEKPCFVLDRHAKPDYFTCQLTKATIRRKTCPLSQIHFSDSEGVCDFLFYYVQVALMPFIMQKYQKKQAANCPQFNGRIFKCNNNWSQNVNHVRLKPVTLRGLLNDDFLIIFKT